jgi:quercetin dioxygenase-like cupin family protein
MLTSPAAHLVVVPPNGPDVDAVPGFTATTRIGSAATGSIAIVEHVFAPRTIVPPHRHTREDEVSYVVSGTLGFRSEDREVELGPGGYIVKPRGELHSMWNPSDEPARMIEVITPGGFERYFDELASAYATAGRRPDPEILAPIAQRYGLTFDFAAMPAIVTRHGLSPR